MSASFVSAMNTRANHFAIDQENHLNILNKQLKELAMFVDLKDRLLDHLYDHANDIVENDVGESFWFGEEDEEGEFDYDPSEVKMEISLKLIYKGQQVAVDIS